MKLRRELKRHWTSFLSAARSKELSAGKHFSANSIFDSALNSMRALVRDCRSAGKESETLAQKHPEIISSIDERDNNLEWQPPSDFILAFYYHSLHSGRPSKMCHLVGHASSAALVVRGYSLVNG